MSLLQGSSRKLAVLCVLIFVLIVIIRDKQDNSDKLDQLQKRLLACNHHSDSLASQLEVINTYKQAVERMMETEKNVSVKVSQAYESKIQYLNAKSDNLQVQLNECKQGTGDASTLQRENKEYRARIQDLENQVKKLSEQNANASNPQPVSNGLTRITFSATTTVKTTSKTAYVNPEDHEDINMQPVENPNFNLVPDNEITFHKRPREPLVFRRDGENPPAIVELLPHEELSKKINDRKAKKEKEKENEEDNVEDFRELAKPDIEEADYKEIEH